jgi:quercetin dioxygenase-like cupin family protein
MPGRTSTAGQTTFSRPFPSAVTYDLSVEDQATIRLPPGSTWTSGPHWHSTHTEFLQVLAGYAEITLAGDVMPAVSAADGVIIVPRGTIHEWRRSQNGGAEEELVVREWTDPKDGQKEAFFRNINGIILDAIKNGDGSWEMRTLELELKNLFWKMDNWPVVLRPSWPGWIQGAASRTVLLGSVIAGKVLGCHGVYQEYSRR